jgi:hypothetical protein
MFTVMDEDCGYRLPYHFLLGQKNPHSSLN